MMSDKPGGLDEHARTFNRHGGIGGLAAEIDALRAENERLKAETERLLMLAATDSQAEYERLITENEHLRGQIRQLRKERDTCLACGVVSAKTMLCRQCTLDEVERDRQSFSQ